LIIKVLRIIIANMAGAEAMLKQAQRIVPTAKPRGKPIDIGAGYERVMGRFPRIMARLGE
jgi:hypothetical protein